ALLQFSLQSTGIWSRISPLEVLGQMPVGVNSLFRIVRCAARRGSAIATAMGTAVFVAIALLVVTVGVLATESRLPNSGKTPTSRLTTKSSRMAECGGERLAPVQVDESRPAPPVITTVVIHFCFSPIELPLSELAGSPQ